MTWIVERVGETLQGAIDGSNDAFVATYDFDALRINVYRNGLQLTPDRDDGYTLELPRTIRLKLPPEVGDTLATEYQALALKTGGGALGGVPELLQQRTLAPSVSAAQNVPETTAEGVEPLTASRNDAPAVSSDDLRPTTIIGRET